MAVGENQYTAHQKGILSAELDAVREHFEPGDKIVLFEEKEKVTCTVIKKFAHHVFVKLPRGSKHSFKWIDVYESYRTLGRLGEINAVVRR